MCGLTARALGSRCRAVELTHAQEQDLAQARRIVLGLLGAHRARVWLYGSRARGDAGRCSDIDIAVWPQAPLPAGTLARLRDALEESTIPYHVDAIDLSTVDEVFRQKVLAEAVPWTD